MIPVVGWSVSFGGGGGSTLENVIPMSVVVGLSENIEMCLLLAVF